VAQVLTINVLVPTAAGLFPAAQPWLLWAVYSLFTSHVDIAFHTTVRAALRAPDLCCRVRALPGTIVTVTYLIAFARCVPSSSRNLSVSGHL
jgi:hypothetical protein